MTKLTGTLSGTATFSGAGLLAGDKATITFTDVLAIHFTGKSSGTITQDVTLSGTVSTPSATFPFTVTENLGTASFRGDKLTVNIVGDIDAVPFSLTGTETIHQSGGSAHVSGTVSGGESIAGTLTFGGTAHDAVLLGVSSHDLGADFLY